MKIYLIEGGDRDGMLVKYVVIDVDEKAARKLVKEYNQDMTIDEVHLIESAAYSVHKIICYEEP